MSIGIVRNLRAGMARTIVQDENKKGRIPRMSKSSGIKESTHYSKYH